MGGKVVMIVFCKIYIPSDSICDPQVQCSSSIFVIVVPLLFTPCQVSGRMVTMVSIRWSPKSRGFHEASDLG